MPAHQSPSPDLLHRPVPDYLASNSQPFEVIETPVTPQQEAPVVQNVHWVPIGLWVLAMTLTLFVFEASEIKALSRHLISRFKIPKKAPCNSCRYFSDNVYLKCTVRPMDVLTDRAVDCHDFCGRSPGKYADINPPKR